MTPRALATAILLACGLALLGACSDDTASPPRADGKAADHRAGDAALWLDRARLKADLLGAKPDQRAMGADTTPSVCPGQGTAACTDGYNNPGKCWAGSCCTGCYDGFAKKCYPPSNNPAFCGAGGAACQVCTGTCVNYTCQ